MIRPDELNNSKWFQGYNFRKQTRWNPILICVEEEFIIHPDESIQAFAERHPVAWWEVRPNVVGIIDALYTEPDDNARAVAIWDMYGNSIRAFCTLHHSAWVAAGSPDPLPPELRAIQDGIDEDGD